jgi:hypothetical protein
MIAPHLARAGRPGDVCVLLLPGDDELPRLHQLQCSLQARYSGRPHTPVHLTCQRFDVEDETALSLLGSQVRSALDGSPPFPIVATSLVEVASPFWGTRLLRWLIRVTDELHHFCALVDDALVAGGARLHYPHSAGWDPRHVTALEDIPEAETAGHVLGVAYPHDLFLARQVVLSRITGVRDFEILDRLALSS